MEKIVFNPSEKPTVGIEVEAQLVDNSSGDLVNIAEGIIKEITSINITRKIDTVGAGDSMLAGICIGLVSGQDAYNSACLGTLAAAVTIQKLYQTGTVSPEELLKMAS